MNESVDQETTGVILLQQVPAAVLLPVIPQSTAHNIQGHRHLHGCYAGPIGSEIQLPTESFTIGRKKGVSCLYIEYPDVSRSHAQIRCMDGIYTLTDLESLNGTFLNGERLPPNRPQLLQTGDQLRFGQDVTYLFHVPEQSA